MRLRSISCRNLVSGATLFALLLMLSACMSRYPLGFSESEWKSLTPQQQFDARKQQSGIDATKRKEKAAQKALKVKQEEQYKELIAYKHKHAVPGDILQCTLNNTVIDFKPGWQKIQKTAFSLVKGEHRDLKVRSLKKYKTVNLWLDYSKDGLTLDICRFKSTNGYQKRKYCSSIVATAQQYQKGYSQNFVVKEYMKANVYCSLTPTSNSNVSTKIQNNNLNLSVKNVFKSLFD